MIAYFERITLELLQTDYSQLMAVSKDKND